MIFFLYNIKMSNYFELLKIEKSYNIDLKILNHQYFAMQAKFHPDQARTNEEKKHNLSISIELNKAYSVLKDDLQRAEYLLSLNNINFNDDSVKQIASKIQLSSIWNELELIEDTNELSALKQLYNNKLLEQKNEISLLNLAFQNHNLCDVVNIITRLKYLKTLIGNLQLKIKFCK